MKRSFLALLVSFACVAAEIIPVEWLSHPRVTASPDGILILTGRRTELASRPFPIDPKKTYRFSLELRRTPGAQPALCYIGNWSIAVGGRKMQPNQVMAVLKSESRLLQAAAKGSREITIQKPECWVSNFKKERWGVVFNVKSDLSDLPNPTYNAIAAARPEGQSLVLTLATPIRRDYPSGTSIRLHSTGDGMYGGWKGKAVPEQWNRIQWEVSGVGAPGNPTTQWWHGTIQGAMRINANFDKESSLEVRNARIEVIENGPAVSAPGEARPAISAPGEARPAISAPGEARPAVSAPSSTLMKLPLLDSVKIQDFDIADSDTSRNFTLPKYQARPGYIPVLRCRMGTYKDGFGGCCFAGKLTVNGTELGAQTAAGEIRMLGKYPRFEMKSSFAGRQFDYWAANDAKIDMPYGPSVDAIDADSVGGNAAVYLLDLRDVLSGNDSNTLTFTNIRPKRHLPPKQLMVRDIEVGYLSESILPAKPSTQVAYEPLSRKCVRGGMTLEAGARGGFVLHGPNGNRLMVESRLGMDFSSPNSLLASDTRSPETPVKITISEFGVYGFRTEAIFPNKVRLVRKLKLTHTGCLQWQEEWRNEGSQIIGIPFHHRLMANIRDPRIWLSGEPEASFIPTPDNNPTLVFETRTGQKRGFGITLESDLARLVSAMRNIGDTAELYSATLALAPGMTQALEFSIEPFHSEGYWGFINRLRDRWHLNDYTAERPLFLGFVPKSMPKGKEREFLQQTFGHLGPIALSIKPWRSGDRLFMLKGNYPKLPENAKRTIGKMPDLDVEAYLTYRHRDELDAYQKQCVDLIHDALPGTWVIQMTHPSMEAVYLPLEQHWEYADCAIRDPKGNLMHMPHYDRSHLKQHAGEDGWVMGYYVPYGGSKYYDKLIDNIRRGMELGFDGLYIDEFGFHFERIGYSRYTYDRWDGFSADLNPDGTVKYLKSDNAYTSAPFQHAAIDMVLNMGKYFLGNLGGGLRSLNAAPNMWFWESNTRIGWTHLYQVPMLLGHVNGNLSQIFAGAREAVNQGCLYSPFAKSAKYLPKDSFVVKQYPMTVIRIMQGGIIGRERIVTIRAGEYEWPGVKDGAKATLFIYDAGGNQIEKGATAIVSNGKIRLNVPEKGMVIAELNK